MTTEPAPASSSRAIVTAVSRSASHSFGKANQPWIRLLAALGVEGDAHLGTTVQHRSRVAVNPTQPNLRQVHLFTEETLAALRAAGFRVAAGELGENVTTRGIDLLALPEGSTLRLGQHAVLRLTGLRNPCGQLDAFQPGLMRALLGRDADGRVLRKAGVMAIVLEGGEVHPGDTIEVQLPAAPHRPLARV